MCKVNTSLGLVAKCSVVGKDIAPFVNKMNLCGFYTYIDDYLDGEELDNDYEVDILIFKYKGEINNEA